MHNKQKKIAVINDFCGFGRCSLAVSLPIISALGLQCCPLPTSIFSNHTGYESFYYTDFTAHMDAYIEEWAKLGLEFSGILTGFLGSMEQIEIVLRFFERFKRAGTVAVVDPVMGDDGRLYPTYAENLARRMTTLLPYADIITPNLTEACILSGAEYTEQPNAGYLTAICKQLSDMGPQKIVVSGLQLGGDLANFVFEAGRGGDFMLEEKVGPFRAGTGDVFSSIIAADTVRGLSLTESVKHASSFIARALRRTMELDLPETDGICFEELLKEI